MSIAQTQSNVHCSCAIRYVCSLMEPSDHIPGGSGLFQQGVKKVKIHIRIPEANMQRTRTQPSPSYTHESPVDIGENKLGG